MVTYAQWNKAIISHFFEESEPGEIVFLQTDANALLEIAEKFKFDVADADEAADSLTEAVRDKVVRSNRAVPGNVDPDSWNNYSENEPSQVAFLALTVFAASLMDPENSAEDTVASNNYYYRLNEVLFGKSVKGTPQGFKGPQFEYFWKHLQLWALEQYTVVLYLTDGSSSRRYVWYPISQCLISMHDRRDVYRFFSDHNLTPFSEISDTQLERDFRIWIRSVGLTKIERYFNTASYRRSILSQVKSLLKHWDGERPPEPIYNKSGKRQTIALINIELHFNFHNNPEIRYWFPTRGRNEIRCKYNALGIQLLQPSHLKKWFRPVPDNKGEFWDWNLPNRLQLQTDETNPIIYTLNLSDIWIFREDSERDGWLSRPKMQLHEDHLIVFRKQIASQVMGCLKQTCEQEIAEANPIYVNGKEHDWLCLRVKPTKPLLFPDQKFWRLSVISGKRLSLIGGLSVKGPNGHKSYLDICLPTVFVPDLGLSDQEPLKIDEQPFPVGEDRLVTLDNALAPGFHVLIYGRQKTGLHVISLERSSEHHDRTLIASISEDQAAIPAYTVKGVTEISGGYGMWLTGAKLLGNIPLPQPPIEDKFCKVPAHIISSVVKLAIDFKHGNTSVPEWFDEAIEYLDQNTTLRALVEKKLNLYQKTALSYMELRKKTGK